MTSMRKQPSITSDYPVTAVIRVMEFRTLLVITPDQWATPAYSLQEEEGPRVTTVTNQRPGIDLQYIAGGLQVIGIPLTIQSHTSS